MQVSIDNKKINISSEIALAILNKLYGSFLKTVHSYTLRLKIESKGDLLRPPLLQCFHSIFANSPGGH